MFGTEKLGSDGGDTNSLRLNGDGLCISLRERNTAKDVVKNRMYNRMCKGVIAKESVNIRKDKEGVKKSTLTFLI